MKKILYLHCAESRSRNEQKNIVGSYANKLSEFDCYKTKDLSKLFR